MNLSEIIIPIVQQAWAIIESYRSHFSVQKKPDTSPVTDADIAASNYLIRAIHDHFPYDIVITEENMWSLNFAKRTWLIDPLDGTKNYIRWEWVYSIILSCVDQGKTILWIIYYPATGKYYYAEQGKGTVYFNGIETKRIYLPIHPPDIHQLTAAYKPSVERFQETKTLIHHLSEVIPTKEVRPSGFICTEVLDGKYDIFILWWGWIYELSAMEILFSEAGGFFGSLTWTPLKYHDTITRHNFWCVWVRSTSLLDQVILPYCQ